jgi:TM2 domain-containing membrane protein YozV
MGPPDISDRSRGVALALSSVLGVFGCHRFYVGKIGSGLCQLFTFGGFGIWYLYDVIMVASGAFRDADGRRLVNWGESDSTRSSHQLSDERIDMLLDEFDQMRAEMGDVVERVDFMERVLARQRDRDGLPRGS